MRNNELLSAAALLAAAFLAPSAGAGDWNVNFAIPETLLGYSGRFKNPESLQIDRKDGTLFLKRGKAAVQLTLATPVGKNEDLCCSFELTRLAADSSFCFGISENGSPENPLGLVYLSPNGTLMALGTEGKYLPTAIKLVAGRPYRLSITYRRSGNVIELACDDMKPVTVATGKLPETVGGAFFIPQPPDGNRVAIRNFRMAWQQAAGN